MHETKRQTVSRYAFDHALALAVTEYKSRARFSDCVGPFMRRCAVAAEADGCTPVEAIDKARRVFEANHGLLAGSWVFTAGQTLPDDASAQAVQQLREALPAIHDKLGADDIDTDALSLRAIEGEPLTFGVYYGDVLPTSIAIFIIDPEE